VQGVVPRQDIAPLLKEGFVALASDADDPEQDVLRLAYNLEDAMMLPFVIFADKEGRFAGGSSGFVNPAAFKAALEQLRKK
jgi:hypothetical protein